MDNTNTPPEGWVTIALAAKQIGLAPASVRYWVDFKGLESMEFEPDFGHKTTLVHIDDVLKMNEKRGKK